jgi:hypothetical protein
MALIAAGASVNEPRRRPRTLRILRDAAKSRSSVNVVAIAVKKIQYAPRISNGRMSAISVSTSVSTSVQFVFS